MLKQSLFWIVYRLADLHKWILTLNDRFEANLTDKQLHFLVIGLVGMVIFQLIHPIIRWLARRGYEIVVSWMYTLTLILFLAFGIEIGQLVTSTGTMDFADIVFGVVGFLAMFFVYAVLSLLLRSIRRFFSKHRRKR